MNDERTDKIITLLKQHISEDDAAALRKVVTDAIEKTKQETRRKMVVDRYKDLCSGGLRLAALMLTGLGPAPWQDVAFFGLITHTLWQSYWMHTQFRYAREGDERLDPKVAMIVENRGSEALTVAEWLSWVAVVIFFVIISGLRYGPWWVSLIVLPFAIWNFGRQFVGSDENQL